MDTLLEIRMSSHLLLLNDFGFTDMIEIPVEGQPRGMVVLWDHTIVTVHSFDRREQEIHTTVEVLPLHKIWLFTSIYASTNRSFRNLLWNNLLSTFDNYKGPWLLGGNFNDVMSVNDKFGGNPINQRRANFLWNCINNCQLMDLGFKRCKYTWSNRRRSSKGLIMERLDKIFANKEWLSLFANVSIMYLPKTYSDHNPLLVELIPKKKFPTLQTL